MTSATRIARASLTVILSISLNERAIVVTGSLRPSAMVLSWTEFAFLLGIESLKSVV